MAFESAQYASSLQIPLRKDSAPSRGPLTTEEALILADKLASDSQKSIYSSLLSIADAVRGLDAQYTTWPTVKFYYSAFYSVRALLSLSSVCMYYVSTKSLWIESVQGSYAEKSPPRAGGSSHKFSFALFADRFPNSPLISQTIDGMVPFDWLMKQREDANYRVPRFVEPTENALFRFVRKFGVRKLCIQYLEDDTFAFDPDHAVFAYPLYLLKHIRKLGVSGRSCVENSDDDSAYEAYFSDRFGPVSALLDLKRAIVL